MKLTYSIFYIIAFIGIIDIIVAIDLSKVQFKDNQKIGIYTGAFDPFHNGHEEVLHYSLKNAGLDYVIIIPNSKQSNYKPFMARVWLRRLLLNHIYGDHQQIITTDFEYDETINYITQLGKQISVVAILGSDNILRYLTANKIPKLHADAWLIIPRENDKENPSLYHLHEFAGKPIILADTAALEHQRFSSTAIKNFLRSHPEFYSNPDYAPTLEELPISQQVRDFIKDFRLYRGVTKEIAESTSLINDIIHDISLCMPGNEQAQIAKAPENSQGLSGNMIFLLSRIEQPTIVIKAFLTVTKDEQFEAENKALDLLATLSLQHSTPVKRVFAHKGKTYHLLGMEYASGKSFESLLKEISQKKYGSVERAEILTTLKQPFLTLGYALAELNTTQHVPITLLKRSDLEPFINKIDQLIDTILLHQQRANLTLVDQQKLHAHKEQSITAFIKNPGFYGYLHGDAQPSNLFIDTNKIIMIDIGGIIKKTDIYQQPRGFPAHELYQFLSSIDYYNYQRYTLNSYELEMIKEYFMEGYYTYLKSHQEQLAPESLAFFKLYWYLHGIQSNLIYLHYLDQSSDTYQLVLKDIKKKLSELI